MQAQVATIDLARAVLTDPAEASPIDQVEETTIDPAAVLVMWTAKLRTGPEVDKTVNGSKTFNAAAVIDLVAAADSAVVALAVADSVAAVVFAAVGDDDTNVLNSVLNVCRT